MIPNNQKVKMLFNGAVLFLMGAIFATVYMYAKEEVETRTEDTCHEPCPECIPKVPLTNLEEQ